MNVLRKVIRKMNISIPTKVDTSWLIATIIAFSIITIILLIGIAKSTPDCPNPEATAWIFRTDYLFPNAIWFIFAFGFTLHGFNFVSVINNEQIDWNEKN